MLVPDTGCVVWNIIVNPGFSAGVWSTVLYLWFLWNSLGLLYLVPYIVRYMILEHPNSTDTQKRIKKPIKSMPKQFPPPVHEFCNMWQATLLARPFLPSNIPEFVCAPWMKVCRHQLVVHWLSSQPHSQATSYIHQHRQLHEREWNFWCRLPTCGRTQQRAVQFQDWQRHEVGKQLLRARINRCNAK